MKLYHSSNLRLSKLTPKIGDNRHSGEDKNIVGKPVIWLSNTPGHFSDVKTGNMYKYRYTIEISETDQDLNKDEEFHSLRNFFESQFGKKPPVWYYLTREIEVLETEEWNGSEYIKITN